MTPTHLYGDGGPIVVVPARIAAWLERHAGLDQLRVAQRAGDPEVYDTLLSLHLAALAWRATATGTPVRQEPAPAPLWLGTTAAAGQLGLAPRTVRLACETGTLPARRIDGRWRIALEDLKHYRATRAA
ncbi:helix-turn-helix domain-containing protein [Kitasatospora sp. NBC_00240]|uniref:helix-turn-helix domain-containing protein n=1 Tax=Kitasatospora sp. NBC_00240 TaxID=2903567 RepID=UPI00225381BF|nr:helix-turn-helix domain-containing protein [Kitasatospora sp. NBC_00240]MCX5211473.1 helix-turn-helix domain-containing protein [Kitasatospora sp. NBC_00240]